MQVVEEALSRPRTSEQHFMAVVPKEPLEEASWFIGGGGDRPVSQWKKDFVRKMNDMANQEAAKEAAKQLRSQASENGDGIGLTYGRGSERLRQVAPSEGRRRARFAPNVRDMDERWDGSTRGGADLAERWQLSSELGDAQHILYDNPELQRVHSAASIRGVLKKTGGVLAREGEAGEVDGARRGYGKEEAWHDPDYHVPEGMVDGTSIVTRARQAAAQNEGDGWERERENQRRQRKKHWMKIDEMEEVDDFGARQSRPSTAGGFLPSFRAFRFAELKPFACSRARRILTRNVTRGTTN